MSKNIADMLVSMLVKAGVKRVYAVTGDSLNPINDAVRRDGRLQWIHVRHEEAGAYAASMEAELEGIACCMGSSGPGHVHLVNGLYDANRAGNPVIAIASTVPTGKLGLDNFQETNVTKLFDDCSKYCFVANTPVQALHALQTGIQHAISQRGVAVIGLPGDVSEADAPEIATGEKNFFPSPVISPSDAEIAELADVINSNGKIMIYCGHGCRHAYREVMDLARKLTAPIGFSYRGKIFFDREDNPFSVGMNGLLGNRSSFTAMQEADVLLMLGTDFPYTEFLPEKNIIVQIDLKPERIGRRAKVDHGYCGDIAATIGKLLPHVERKVSETFLNEMREIHASVQKDYRSYIDEHSKKDMIHPEYVASVIDGLATDDAIFTVDTGMSAVWAARYLGGKRNRYMTGSFNHGSMANAMPMALGAALCQPERQVIAMCGDGGITMLLGDLMTISQYKAPVKVIVFNNRSLAMVELEMRVAGYPDWKTDMVNPDFTKVAEAMGIRAWKAEKSGEVKLALEEAFAHEGPALIEIFTDKNALAMPPHVTFDQVKGYATSMAKLMFTGHAPEVVEFATSSIKYLKELK